ncbi:DUF6265 family protein [Sphingopyxis sp.]|uniref:DUF6265 family protein n=1 Tax=Sphingopyxis sp. TaxID=1908224 RepID=UPI003BAC4C2E
MKRWMQMAASLLLIAAKPAATLDDLAWMAGSWVEEKSDEANGVRWTEEYWTVPRGGVMLGASRSGRGARLGEFEFLRLAAGTDGTIAYLAQPGGGAPVAFRLAQHDAMSATFENAAHDYPQRIRYVRGGDVMTATISKIDGSKAQSWIYKRR